MSFHDGLLLEEYGVVAPDFPSEQWSTATPKEAGLDEAQLNEARDYALTGGGSGYLVRGGKLVFSWGDAAQRYDLKSTSKSFGAAALGLAIKDVRAGKSWKRTEGADHYEVLKPFLLPIVAAAKR